MVPGCYAIIIAVTDCVPDAGTVDVFAQQAAVIVFSDDVVAIIDVFDYVTTNDIFLMLLPAGSYSQVVMS